MSWVDFLNNSQITIFFQILLASFLGCLIGLERESKRKEAGLRTYALVCVGAAFFTIISYEVVNLFPGLEGLSFDPARIIGQVVIGIGFLGAGLIIFKGFHIEGLTTAAGLWVTAAVGAGIGAKLYLPAIFVAFVTVGILAGLRLIEEKFFEKENK